MSGLKEQLAPGWSALNIAIIVVLFFVAWPLALVMIAYIVWGEQAGLDLSKPATLGIFVKRLGTAWKAAKEAFKRA